MSEQLLIDVNQVISYAKGNMQNDFVKWDRELFHYEYIILNYI